MTTYFVSDERMFLHRSEWDPTHPETPRRLACILEEIRDAHLLEKCTILEAEVAPREDICLGHPAEFLTEIEKTTEYSTEQCWKYSESKEDIYVNSHTYEAAMLSAGSALKAMRAVIGQRGNNAFAAVRPPGHHSSFNYPQGFCIFNNVAICAKKARSLGVERVLIVDWDVHHGNGTQYSIEDDPNGIKLISIHRYEHGTAWPELPEGGAIHHYANTINVPLNELGYGDAEYSAFIDLLVLPIISEWRPELILVSCGFDAGLGDLLGEMEVSPIGFGYMMGALAATQIPLCALLEGGYFLPSVAKGALFAIRALVERVSFLHTLFSTMAVCAKEFTLLEKWLKVLNKLRVGNQLVPIGLPSTDDYRGNRQVEFPYQQVGLYPPLSDEAVKAFSDRLENILCEYEESLGEQHQHKKPKLSVTKKAAPENVVVLTCDEDKWEIKLRDEAELRLLHFFVLAPLSWHFEVCVGAHLEAFLTASHFSRVHSHLQPSFAARNDNERDGDSGFLITLEKLCHTFSVLSSLMLFH